MTPKIHVAADGLRLIRDDNGEQIGRGLARDWKAEKTCAARLAHCWNCHDELVSALQNAVWKLQDLSEWSRAYCHPQQASSVTATADECRAILAKAKGES